jgi:hypothetical protein
MGSSDSVAARRAVRKQAQVTIARECGGRFARAHPDEVDLAAFLEQLPVSRLTPSERRARAALLSATWRAAFAQGWRSVQPAQSATPEIADSSMTSPPGPHTAVSRKNAPGR